jgi:hypothetical protein
MLEVGSTFAGYRIEEVLDGRESAGAVYVATYVDFGRPLALAPWLPVALKVFEVEPDRPPWSPGVLELADLQTKLRHPNVVPIYEIGTAPAPFMSMSLVRGPSLAELLASRELDDLAALDICRAVAAALDAGRQDGLVYRDLRPDRVLVPDRDPSRACLGDFGAGRPEDVEADVASNVRGLASILFECLTFESPWRAARPLRELRDDLPAELEDVLAAALDEDPARRQASAGELMRGVDGAYPDPLRPARPRAAPSGGGPRVWRRASVRAVAAAAVVTCAVIVGALVAARTAPDRGDRDGQAQVLDTRDLTLRYPADWVRAARIPDVPGLALREAVALAPPGVRPAGEGGRAVVVGSIGPWNPGLHTRALSQRQSAESRRELVQLGALQGYRHRGVRLAGSGRAADVYLLRTSDDAIAVACIAPPGSAAFIAACERVASTVRLKGARPVALGPSPRYTRALRRIVSDLEAVRVPKRRQLSAARSAEGEATAATRISLAYREARRSAARLMLPVAPELHAATVEALGSAADGYARMAAAASRSDQASWDSGRALVLSSERELERTFRDLAALRQP